MVELIADPFFKDRKEQGEPVLVEPRRSSGRGWEKQVGVTSAWISNKKERAPSKPGTIADPATSLIRPSKKARDGLSTSQRPVSFI